LAISGLHLSVSMTAEIAVCENTRRFNSLLSRSGGTATRLLDGAGRLWKFLELDHAGRFGEENG
jgi:hypothetical protein